jgi:predicted nucleic acid-binding protein
MLIGDTGPLVAMLNAKDQQHEACTALFRRFRGPIVVPVLISTLLRRDFGAWGAARFLVPCVAR